MNIDNLITILFQIGFREMDEHEIVFSSFEEKLDFRKGMIRYFKHSDGKGEIDIDIQNIRFIYSAWEEERKHYLQKYTLSATSINDILVGLEDAYKHEIRQYKINNILNGKC